MILEHPHLEKGYKEFKKYLENAGRIEDAAALEYLLKTKFNDINDSNPN